MSDPSLRDLNTFWLWFTKFCQCSRTQIPQRTMLNGILTWTWFLLTTHGSRSGPPWCAPRQYKPPDFSSLNCWIFGMSHLSPYTILTIPVVHFVGRATLLREITTTVGGMLRGEHFWKSVHNTIKEELGWDIPFSKESLLLNIWDDDAIPASSRDQMAIMASVAGQDSDSMVLLRSVVHRRLAN